MKTFKPVLPTWIAVANLSYGQSPDPTTPKPDNTKVNERDRNAARQFEACLRSQH